MQPIEFEARIHNGAIQLPENCQRWPEKTVRVIVFEKNSEIAPLQKRRRPHHAIAGKGKTLGDLVAPVVDKADWECLK
uniref:Uncharacterized protein n=1 Tax=Candidatus Kentrum sp. FW TaxID=2126338 RepID=A0A450TKB8_9GAMM|nr:MAG: hypothetical protein BECKFW1821C_GA0114237_101342 [Candidatus Kentron sp. FW]